jgi:hypothetical protein
MGCGDAKNCCFSDQASNSGRITCKDAQHKAAWIAIWGLVHAYSNLSASRVRLVERLRRDAESHQRSHHGRRLARHNGLSGG